MDHFQVERCAVLLLSILCSVAAQTMIPISPADKEEILAAHNRIRGEAEATDMRKMVYDDDLAAFPEQHSLNCVFQHSGNEERMVDGYLNVGENLYASSASVLDFQSAIYESWGTGERQYYNYNSNTCDDGQVCGHYTQLVWANSGSVGCGAALCPTLGGTAFTNARFLVCNYGPAGNFVGQSPYRTNGEICSACPDSLPACRDNLCSPQGDEEPDVNDERLSVSFVGNTPRIRGRTVTVMVKANKPVESILCYFNGGREQDCTSGRAVFNNVPYTNRPYQLHYLRVEATTSDGEAKTIIRAITVCPPNVCTAQFTNAGVRALSAPGSVRISFTSTGPARAFICRVDGQPYARCASGKVFRGLSSGLHKIKVVPIKCRRRRGAAKRFLVQ